MEKYRQIKWNKEIEIQRERNNSRIQNENSNRYLEINSDLNRSNKREFPIIKIMLGATFGIVFAGLATLAIKLVFVQAILEPFMPIQQEKELRAYQAEVKLDNLKQEQQQILEQRTNQAKRKEEAIRAAQQRAEINARDLRQNEAFKAQYKKPSQCYNIQYHEMRVNCANDYIRARADFAKKYALTEQNQTANNNLAASKTPTLGVTIKND